MARISTLRRGAGIQLTDLVSLGALTRCIPLERVREVLKETGRESQRQRDLPAHVMVYLVIALGCTGTFRLRRCCGAWLKG